MTEEAGKTPLEDIKQDALNHYEQLANAAHYWNSFIPIAIKAYNPEVHNQFLSYLDQQIAICTTWDNAVKPHETSIEADQFRIRARALEQVREKFIQLVNSES